MMIYNVAHTHTQILLGKHRKISELGNGEWTNKPMRALGNLFLTIFGTNSK